MGAPEEPRRVGRPRDARADESIVSAVMDLLAEVGFGGLTVDAVAQRAGVGKATIYRRWEGKEQLVLDALEMTKQHVPRPDTGSLREDLVAYYEPLARSLAQQGAIRLMPAMAAEAAMNPDLAERLRAFVAARRAPLVEIVSRAQARSELPEELDVDLLLDLITGPIMYRLYFSGAVVDMDLIETVVDVVLQAMSVRASRLAP